MGPIPSRDQVGWARAIVVGLTPFRFFALSSGPHFSDHALAVVPTMGPLTWRLFCPVIIMWVQWQLRGSKQVEVPQQVIG